MGRYNLLDEAWIPVLRKDTGKVEEVSLLTLFSQAQEYYALAGEMETQNFAVLRVLLAVLVTVFTRVDAEGEPYDFLMLDETTGARFILSAPVDEIDADDYMDALDETWKTIWKQHRFPEIVCQYLEAWRDRFYLLDETYPFFQVTKQDLKKRLPEGKGTTALNAKSFAGKQINRLISESNNKEAIFTPVVGNNKSRMSEAELTRWLITMQGYVGTSDKGKFPSDEKVTNSKGWLYDIGGIYMEGDDIFETLWMNTMLHHVGDERYTLAPQTPCWEYCPSVRLDEILQGTPQNNLASLYTVWSRAIYIPTDWTAKKDVSIGAIKLTEIEHENAFIEPMTLWSFNKTGNHKNQFTPRVHRPEQSLWRSFGLLITDKTNTETKNPGIIDYYHMIASFLDNRMVKLHAVSMLSDGNATSWMPVDEVTDVLSLHEMVLTDTDEDGWSIRVRDTAEDTKAIIEQVYRPFLKKVAKIRGIELSDFVEYQRAVLYEAVDGPFRNWLQHIQPQDSKDTKVYAWKRELRYIVLAAAEHIINHLSARDYVGKENSVTAYQWFKFQLNQRIPLETDNKK